MHILQRSPALLLLVLGAASLCNAANITYNVNLTIGAGSVVGDIVTDGTVGLLGSSNILDWNLLFTNPSNTYDSTGPLSGSNSLVTFAGTDYLSATANQLEYNFSGTPGSGFLSFGPGNANELCFSNVPFCQDQQGVTGGIGLEINNNLQTFQFDNLSGTQAIASSAPEPSALALLGAGIAFLGLRKRVNSHDIV